MRKEWTLKIPIKTKRARVLLNLAVTLFVFFLIWFLRMPIAATDIKVNEVKVSGNNLIFDGTYKDKITRYKSYSLRINSSGDVIIKLYGGFIGGPRDIHIETKAVKNIRAVYLYTPGEVRANKIWPTNQ